MTSLATLLRRAEQAREKAEAADDASRMARYDLNAEARRIAHDIGLSRLVCGMHYPSDVAAGEVLGKAVFDTAAAMPGFNDDLAAARADLAAARAAGLTSPGCASERLALATPLP